MKKCPTCNKTYPDSSSPFCAEDGTRLTEVTEDKPDFQPLPSSAAAPIPQNQNSQSPPERKKQSVAGIISGAAGLGLGFLVLLVLLIMRFAISEPSIETIRTVAAIGVILGILALLLSLAAIIMIKRLAKLLGVAALLITVIAIGVSFALAFVVGPHSMVDRLTSSPTDSQPSSNSSNKSVISTVPATITENDKYRLFYAASTTTDQSLIVQTSKKIGILDAGNKPTDSYKGFIQGLTAWAFKDTEFVCGIH